MSMPPLQLSDQTMPVHRGRPSRTRRGTRRYSSANESPLPLIVRNNRSLKFAGLMRRTVQAHVRLPRQIQTKRIKLSLLKLRSKMDAQGCPAACGSGQQWSRWQLVVADKRRALLEPRHTPAVA